MAAGLDVRLCARMLHYLVSTSEQPGARVKAWRDANPDKVRAYREANAARIKARQIAYRRTHAKECAAARRAWNKANPDKVRAYRKQNAAQRPSQHHGKTRTEILALLARQGGRCAVCATTEPGGRGWTGDHNHANGRLRAVLCMRCNVGLGYFGDNAERMHLAAAYVERHAQLDALL